MVLYAGLRRSGLAPSAVEAAQADEVQGRLLRGQSLLSNDAATTIPEVNLAVVAVGGRSTSLCRAHTADGTSR